MPDAATATSALDSFDAELVALLERRRVAVTVVADAAAASRARRCRHRALLRARGSLPSRVSALISRILGCLMQ
jgi:chorismate mutase